jgi:hypothetical protein
LIRVTEIPEGIPATTTPMAAATPLVAIQTAMAVRTPTGIVLVVIRMAAAAEVANLK